MAPRPSLMTCTWQSLLRCYVAVHSIASHIDAGSYAAHGLHERQLIGRADGDYTEDALQRLGPIADVLLTHNRPIVRPVDDSIVRNETGRVSSLATRQGIRSIAAEDFCSSFDTSRQL